MDFRETLGLVYMTHNRKIVTNKEHMCNQRAYDRLPVPRKAESRAWFTRAVRLGRFSDGCRKTNRKEVASLFARANFS